MFVFQAIAEGEPGIVNLNQRGFISRSGFGACESSWTSLRKHFLLDEARFLQGKIRITRRSQSMTIHTAT